jgi:hypothetical protein
MPLLNLKQAQKLYFGNTEVEKLYKGDQLLLPITDPFADDILLYCKGDAFLDDSPNQKAVNASPSSSISTTFKKYGTGSFNFTVDNSRISVPNLAGVQNFNHLTIEFWAYFVSTASKGFLQFSNLTNIFTNNSVSSPSMQQIRYFGNNNFFLPDSIPLNQWCHLAFVHTSNFLTIFLNGAEMVAVPFTTPVITVTEDLNIGTHINTTSTCKGYFDSFRITNAVRYRFPFDCENDTFLAY